MNINAGVISVDTPCLGRIVVLIRICHEDEQSQRT